jgi:two-component system chemotaxis response regulator CheB
MAEKTHTRKAVVIGGSAGSLPAIVTILKNLPSNLSVPVIIVIHRNNDPNSGLTNVFDQVSALPVKEAEDKEYINASSIYLAPADYHLFIEKDFSFSLDGSEKINFSRPSIDATLQTAAEAFRNGLLAILLSGANDDGTNGFREVRSNGGMLIAQDPQEASTAFMPQNVINEGLADKILRSDEISLAIVNFAAGFDVPKSSSTGS